MGPPQVVMNSSLLKVAGYSFRKSHCSHTNVILSATRDRAFIMVDHIALSYHILTRGGVIAHNQRGGLLVFIVDNQFNYFIVVGWFDVLADDTSESFFIFFMFSVILIFIEQFQVLLVVFGCCV